MPKNNVISLVSEVSPTRLNRGAFVEASLRQERWTVRQAAMKLGMSPTALGDRLKGRVSFLAEDIEEIARLLRVDPIDFYRKFINATPVPTPSSPAGRRENLKHTTSDYSTVVSLAERRAAKHPA